MTPDALSSSIQSNDSRLGSTFWVEVLALFLAAPLIFFPSFLGSLASFAGILLLIGALFWRRYRLGLWHLRTAYDWPLLLLFGLMLPISVWAAPPPLREVYALPRALILLWNLALFSTVALYGGASAVLRRWVQGGFLAAGVAIALAALLGTQWASKVPVVGTLLGSLPSPLLGLFSGAADGFNPNQVGGSLLYVIPSALGLIALLLRSDTKRTWAALAIGAGSLVIFVFLAAQSRTAYLALGVGAGLTYLLGSDMRRRWPYLAPVAILLGGIGMVIFIRRGAGLLFSGSDGTTASLAGRIELWERAIHGIADFPLTGMGLGTFRELVHVFYPTVILDPALNLGHAHNFFLQSALDFGLPGLIAILALFLIAMTQLLVIEERTAGVNRFWVRGLMAAFLAQLFFALPDAVAMGSKTGFLLWYLLALIQIERPIASLYSGASADNVAD